MKVVSLILFIFLAFSFIAQNKKEKWVKKVDLKADSLSYLFHTDLHQTDSTFWEFQMQLKKQMSGTYFNRYSHKKMKNGEEVIILNRIPNNPILDHYSMNAKGYLLYFEKDQLIKIVESYSNSSRMGSCGTLEIKNEIYFKNNKIENIYSTEAPFKYPCYGDVVDSSFILNLGMYMLQQKELLDFKYFNYQLKKYQKEHEPEYISHFNDQKSYDSIQNKLKYYELKWVQEFYLYPESAKKKETINFNQFLLNTNLTFIGEKYLIIKIYNNSQPMNIQPFTTYYFERKEGE